MLRKTGYAILFLAVVAAGTFLFVRWRQSVRLGRQLDRAERLMPDSSAAALCLLDSIDGAAPMSGRNHARYALLLTQAQYKNDLVPRNDSLIRIAVDYYSASSDSLRKAWSCFYMAQTLRDTYEPKRALDYFRQAASAASATDDNRLRSLIYNHWGLLLQSDRPYEMGLKKLLEAEKYAEADKDTTGLIYILRDIGWSYVYMADYEKANRTLRAGIKLATDRNNTNLLIGLYKYLSMSYEQAGQYPEALRYVNKALSFVGEDSLERRKLNITKLLILNDLQQYDSVRYYMNRANHDKKYYAIASDAKQAYRMEKGMGNYKKALEYHERYALYQDSDYIETIDHNLIGLQQKYDYAWFEYENIKLKSKVQERTLMYLSLVAILLLVILVSFSVYVKKEKKRKELIKTKDALINQNLRELQKKTNELLLQRQELSDKEQALKESMVQKNTLEEEKNRNELLLAQLSSQQSQLKERIFKLNETVRKIESLESLNPRQKQKSKADLLLSKQDLTNLFDAMNFCHNSFEERLRSDYSLLTEDDIYVCCLLRMGVCHSDIALLLDTNEEALKKRKYRIKREKIGLENDGVALENFLSDY